MTKVVIRKQNFDNGKRFFQIFWTSANGSVESNTDASLEQVIGVSNVAMRAGFEYAMEVKPLDSGQEIIDTWVNHSNAKSAKVRHWH